MLSTIAGGAVMGLILNAFAGSASLSEANQVFFAIPFWHHLILGGFMFGAIFMATDPVSGSQTVSGKWIYGFLIGILAVLIRVVNPRLSGGNDACHSVNEHLCTADRPLCCSGPH